MVDETALNPSGPLERAQKRFKPVTAGLGDSVRIRRAVNVDGRVPLTEAFSPLASRAIEEDQPDTYYTDSSGGAGNWYLLTNWNEPTDEETPLDLSATVCGDDYARYASLGDTRAEAVFTNSTNLSDTDVDQQRRAAEAEINGKLVNNYETPFKPVPEAVRILTEKLAAAFLLLNAYGSKYQKLVDEARAPVQLYANRAHP